MNEMLFSITNDIARFFRGYAYTGGLLAIVVTIAYLFYEGYWKTRGLNIQLLERRKQICTVARQAAYIFLLVLYLYIVIGITILSRSESGTWGASFEVFRTFRNTFYARKQIYENIIMFVPYAMLLYGLAERFRSLWRMLLIGAGSSLLIEVTQWLTRTGYFEVDDILTNTIGMLLGYLVCLLIEKLYRQLWL